MFKKIIALILIATSVYSVSAFAEYNVTKEEAFNFFQDEDFDYMKFDESKINIIHSKDFDCMGFEGEVFKLAGIENDLYAYSNYGITFYVDTNTWDMYKKQGGVEGETFSKMSYQFETYPIEVGRWSWKRYRSPVHNNLWEYTGWQPENGWRGSDDTGWKYYDNGEMDFGWKKINGEWHYFLNTGRMATNCTIDGYYLGNDGKCQLNK
ncbi:hypothetical protein [Clostridium sp. SM-530-WT-3G]|uniref:hypothetical protein n=1 Tax=Clostridium sp. SM-530-WT-3G TaxID=2725303 RepID=UPI00145EAD41|nr:hypothetical protein [Clostridium sp. SM-530-WT-3G]NME83987.1 hypothetical protein [Clostridium sp. SM-530-WT-3G]